MADAFLVSQPTVWRWLNQSKQLPADKVLLAEQLTSVPRYHLRPDYYPYETPVAAARWDGMDQRVEARFVGTDRRARYDNRNKHLDKTARVAQ